MRLVILLAIVILGSCSARYHVEQAKKKGALMERDTVFKEIIIPKTVTDTVTRFTNRIFTDTVEIETVKWKTKTRIDTVGRIIYQQVECKEKIKIVPVEVNTKVDCPPGKGIKKFWAIIGGIGIGLLSLFIGVMIGKILG